MNYQCPRCNPIVPSQNPGTGAMRNPDTYHNMPPTTAGGNSRKYRIGGEECDALSSVSEPLSGGGAGTPSKPLNWGNNFGEGSGHIKFHVSGGGGNEAPPIVNKEYTCNHDWRAFRDDSYRENLNFYCTKCLTIVEKQY